MMNRILLFAVLVAGMMVAAASVALAAPTYINESRVALTHERVLGDARFASFARQFGLPSGVFKDAPHCAAPLPVGAAGKFRFGLNASGAQEWATVTPQESAVMAGMLYELPDGWFLHAQLCVAGNAGLFYGHLPSRDGQDGVPGPEGPAGPKGDTGATGPVGPEGPRGPAGPAGARGSRGPAGTNGQDGAPGRDGVDAVVTQSAPVVTEQVTGASADASANVGGDINATDGSTVNVIGGTATATAEATQNVAAVPQQDAAAVAVAPCAPCLSPAVTWRAAPCAVTPAPCEPQYRLRRQTYLPQRRGGTPAPRAERIEYIEPGRPGLLEYLVPLGAALLGRPEGSTYNLSATGGSATGGNATARGGNGYGGAGGSSSSSASSSSSSAAAAAAAAN